MEYHISNYKNIIDNLRTEIVGLKSQLTEAKKGGSIKLGEGQENPFLPEIVSSSAGTPKLEQGSTKSTNLKRKQLELNVHFEKEAIHKKKILE